TLAVSGQGSIVQVAGDLQVGDQGAGTLTISDRGAIEVAGDIIVGADDKSESDVVTVTGDGTKLDVERIRAINGTINVKNGGELDVSSEFDVGVLESNSDGDATVNVDHGKITVGELRLSQTSNLTIGDGSSFMVTISSDISGQIQINSNGRF